MRREAGSLQKGLGILPRGGEGGLGKDEKKLQGAHSLPGLGVPFLEPLQKMLCSPPPLGKQFSNVYQELSK